MEVVYYNNATPWAMEAQQQYHILRLTIVTIQHLLQKYGNKIKWKKRKKIGSRCLRFKAMWGQKRN
jgi:hypothetical protein